MPCESKPQADKQAKASLPQNSELEARVEAAKEAMAALLALWRDAQSERRGVEGNVQRRQPARQPVWN